jgi:FkbM family methyltransferase
MSQEAMRRSPILTLGRLISPGMVVVDGGASCGIYTVAAAKLVGPSGLIFSFKPGAEAFTVLRDNIGLNGLKNVRMYRAALSETEGKAALYHHAHGPNSFSLGGAGESSIEFEEVTSRTLSRAAQEEGVQRIDLIRLDVEGAEEHVLRDAEQLIARSRPIIILEVNGIAVQRLGLDPLGSWRALQKLGYTFFSLTEWGDLCPLHRAPLRNEIINVIAIHDKGRK